jgi:hypothetical protein
VRLLGTEGRSSGVEGFAAGAESTESPSNTLHAWEVRAQGLAARCGDARAAWVHGATLATCFPALGSHRSFELRSSELCPSALPTPKAPPEPSLEAPLAAGGTCAEVGASAAARAALAASASEAGARRQLREVLRLLNAPDRTLGGRLREVGLCQDPPRLGLRQLRRRFGGGGPAADWPGEPSKGVVQGEANGEAADGVTAEALWRDATVVVGMHPDEAGGRRWHNARAHPYTRACLASHVAVGSWGSMCRPPPH